MASEKPEFKWESIKVGMVAGERDITVLPEMVAAHLEGVEASRDWYESDSTFGGPIAPPMIFINDVLQIIAGDVSRAYFLGSVADYLVKVPGLDEELRVGGDPANYFTAGSKVRLAIEPESVISVRDSER
ncbi:MAG: TOBE domain-containing protein [Nitrospinaceae bacterium]|jgi:hypothetical protein|nr:TOBE domain-containing protein [Nitrospinaceae bacterium]MBT3822942.1 TOBE domain-containing protein [Nitrospinaceae bacterium]MBT4093363.1 TOBE domain-containing protein [Nitrospinaceae bacterium]MBT5368904.1 TOBE domain-containing protein [Nitrospinaceae bacterium]MBT5949129.1 TOBE domain-containing protein [Nitrospinaceae bacterium]